MRIFLDMDEVLVDFVGGCCAAWGVTREQVLAHWPPGVWDVVPPLSRALGRQERMPEWEFWQKLEATPNFWQGLQPLPWAKDVLAWAASKTDEWFVLTSPSRCPTCIPAKQKLLASLLGVPYTDRLIPTPHKYLMAKHARCVLVDDREAATDQFTREGGHGVLFPRHHNSALCHKDQPLQYVADKIRELGL